MSDDHLPDFDVEDLKHVLDAKPPSSVRSLLYDDDEGMVKRGLVEPCDDDGRLRLTERGERIGRVLNDLRDGLGGL